MSHTMVINAVWYKPVQLSSLNNPMSMVSGVKNSEVGMPKIEKGAGRVHAVQSAFFCAHLRESVFYRGGEAKKVTAAAQLKE